VRCCCRIKVGSETSKGAAFGMGVTRILWFKEAWWLTAGAILSYAAGYGMVLYADYGSINV